MMTPAQTRVSILERLVPSFAFAIAAISGAIGGVMLLRFLNELRQAETAGYAAFFGGMSEIEFAVGIVLIFAVVFCAIGILVSIIRLFTTNTKASPPGLLFLMTGLLSTVPPFALHYVLHLMKGIVATHAPDGGISSVAGTINAVAYFSIGAAAVIALVMLAFSFIPFSSRPARKSSPLICLMLVEILFIFLAGVYFWEARTSIAERDRDRVEEYSQPSESPSLNSNPTDLPNQVDDMLDGINGASKDGGDSEYSEQNPRRGSKTTSGGVLNDKAIEMPPPAYPPAARAVRASGRVSVQVLVDENGQVISATAVSGHPLLRAAAVQAARKARFAPSKMSGQTVRMAGVLTYNFSGE
jgi:protein TonB